MDSFGVLKLHVDNKFYRKIEIHGMNDKNMFFKVELCFLSKSMSTWLISYKRTCLKTTSTY